jgi:hypothetical protein
MPLALDVSIYALALYEYLLRREAEGKPAFGIRQDIEPRFICGLDRESQRAWEELLDAGLVVEASDYGRYSRYTYNAERQAK